MNEDLSVFFDTDEHAETLTFSIPGGGSVELDGIWDAPFAAEVGMESTAPQFLVIESEGSTIAQGSTATRNGTGYRVRYREPDGAGLMALVLEAP